MTIQRFMLNSDVLRPLAATITKSMYKTGGQWDMWYRKFSSSHQKFNIVRSPDNQSVVDIISKYPQHLLGWIFVNPAHEDSLEQLEKWRNIRSMIGVKIHPFWHQYPVEKVERLAKRTEEIGLPMLVHLGFEPCGNYLWLIEQFPKLKIIFAHLGVPYYKQLWPAVVRRNNVFMDISSTYHVDEKLVKVAVKTVGPHKCIFGTDSPYSHKDSDLRIKKWVENLSISDSDKDRIFSKNFMELISL
jgi:predicted TIM-barrel fold metal-dependent hydrolase